MDNKLISITANPVELTRVEPEIETQVSITETSSAVITNQIIESTDYRFNTDVSLTGYGEESIPSSVLFLRPDNNNQTVTYSERVSKVSGKNINEQFTRTEQVRVLLNKVNTDLFDANDLVTLVASFQRTFADASDAVDVLAVLTQKPFADSYVTSDVATRALAVAKLDVLDTVDAPVFNFAQQLADAIAVTDDVLGEANIDDDQIAVFNKVLVDSGTLTEALSFTATFIRSVSDTSTSTEQAQLLLNKPATELLDTTDATSVVADFQRVFLETEAVTEALAASVQKPLTDNYVASDVLSASYASPALDIFDTSDTVSYLASFNRVFTEAIDAVDDSRIVVFGKVLVDITGTTQDTASFQLTRTGGAFVDTVTNSETKTANIQNYFQADFVQAGYVGTNLTL